ncbi:peptidoglycan bridge formation glycyltransferase FemA/FemB family protein [Patescibacteria group bacterium]|nr:MAG: peptidoglycan bridge formation glycyltransferase FemA/FemB family protein [Patescibacteria group bacterium]
MQPATEEQLAGWDELIVANPDGGNVLQSKAFGETKGKHGWTPRYFMADKLAVLVLERQVPLLGRFWYVPKGPGVSTATELKKFIKALPANGPFAVRVDPEIATGAIKPAELKRLGMVKAPRDIQYNTNTAIIDLRPGEDDILASFKQKTRYNIRLAAKRGVTVEAVECTAENIDIMYELTRAMTERAGVYLRDKQYFVDFYRAHAARGAGQLFFAKYEGQVLAGAFVTHIGRKALYKDGGSLRLHSEVQAPYALQWGVMQWLKQHGVTEYDLHGTPPADKIEDPKHPLAGLARFKTGFNKEITEYIGTYDIVLNQSKYSWFRRLGERVVVAYEYRFRHRLWY